MEKRMTRVHALLRCLPLLTAMGAGGMVATGCGPEMAAPSNGELSFEAFAASVARDPEGAYIVEGDIPVWGEEALRAYYEQSRRAEQDGPLVQRRDGLIVNTVGGADDKWSDVQKRQLTYCVSSTSFGANYATAVNAMSTAAGAWEQAAYVKFVHVSAEDGNCDQNNNNVLFDVRMVGGTGYTARAFFPSDGRSTRNVLIDWNNATNAAPKTLVGILRHELGHTLGFRHEHIRVSGTDCAEPANWRALTPYDSASVMHYRQCLGGSWSYGDYALTASDKDGAVSLYGPSYEVGVIPNTAACPAGSDLLSINQDNEDSSNANGRSGWYGAIVSNSDTTHRFCRVDGSQFKPLSTSANASLNYAVLKLGYACPVGSTEFSRYFDDEDTNNSNWNSGSLSSPANITPNFSATNTHLVFCLFTNGSSTMGSFPVLGISYGVYAPGNFAAGLALGSITLDDEDTNNNNSYSAPSSILSAAQQIITPGQNTTMQLAKVR